MFVGDSSTTCPMMSLMESILIMSYKVDKVRNITNITIITTFIAQLVSELDPKCDT